MALSVGQLAPGDLRLMEALLMTFGQTVDEVQTYGRTRPSAAHRRPLLGSDYFIALAAMKNGEVVGGIAALS